MDKSKIFILSVIFANYFSRNDSIVVLLFYNSVILVVQFYYIKMYLQMNRTAGTHMVIEMSLNLPATA